eukprot:5160483-Pleurochrysis_carterae.AAC.4
MPRKSGGSQVSELPRRTAACLGVWPAAAGRTGPTQSSRGPRLADVTRALAYRQAARKCCSMQDAVASLEAAAVAAVSAAEAVTSVVQASMVASAAAR